MAIARATPNEGEERVATNVAKPSGKLWMPIARPVVERMLMITG